MRPSLDIVIVNWNTGPELHTCLQSIVGARADDPVLSRVVVVDNASDDLSLQGIERLPLPLEVIRNSENRGFGAACNQGARASTSDYLLFLNPDTRLSPDALRVPAMYLGDPQNQSVGICGIALVDASGQPTTTHARFPSVRVFAGQVTGLSRVLSGLFPPHLGQARPGSGICDVDQVIGAFFMVRRSLFDALGGFDERFFVYFEEVDLSLRASQIGFRSVCLTDVTSVHIGGVSSDRVRAQRLFYSLRSRAQYASKHFTWPGRLAVPAITWLLEFPIRLGRALLAGSLGGVMETVRAYAMLLVRRRRGVATSTWREE